MTYLGDIVPGQVLRFWWQSNAVAGESITRATNGTISVYKDASDTQSTTGITDGEDTDGLAGVHRCAIDTSADGTFYSAGSDFAVILSAATIDGKTINAVLAHFSIANRSALRPTTAARTLDVSAGGEAGVDWANVGSPTTALNLSGTTVKTATDVETDTADIQTRVPAALVSGRIDASVGAMAANVLTAAAAAADLTTELQSGLATAAAVSALPTAAGIADAVWDEDATGHQTQGTFGQAIGDPVADADTIWGLVNTNLDAAVSSRLATAGYTVPPTVGAVADQVWEEAIADHSGTVGSTAEALGAAGSAGDPWTTALPGAYGAGSAGKIVGDNLNATVGSRATQASVDTVDGIVDAILLDTAEIGTAGAGLAAMPWNAAWDAQVESEVADALAVYDPPTKAELDSAVAPLATAAGVSALNNLSAAQVKTQADQALTDAGVTTTVTGRIDAAISTRSTYAGGAVASVTGAVGSVTAPVTVGTNNDKTGYALTSGERTSVADALLDRDMATGADSGSPTVRTVRNALRPSRNKVAVAGGTASVFKEDDATVAWTAAVVTTAGDAISSIDPASA